MLHMWLRCVTLQSTDEDHNIQASVREISNSAEQRHVELVQFRAAKVFNFGMLHLSMDNGPEISNVHNLIQGDLLGQLVLNVTPSKW